MDLLPLICGFDRRSHVSQPTSYSSSLIRTVSLFCPLSPLSQSSSRLTKNNPRETDKERERERERELWSGGCPRVISICPLQSGIISQESAFPRLSAQHSWPIVLQSPFSFRFNRRAEPSPSQEWIIDFEMLPLYAETRLDAVLYSSFLNKTVARCFSDYFSSDFESKRRNLLVPRIDTFSRLPAQFLFWFMLRWLHQGQAFTRN